MCWFFLLKHQKSSENTKKKRVCKMEYKKTFAAFFKFPRLKVFKALTQSKSDKMGRTGPAKSDMDRVWKIKPKSG